MYSIRSKREAPVAITVTPCSRTLASEPATRRVLKFQQNHQHYLYWYSDGHVSLDCHLSLTIAARFSWILSPFGVFEKRRRAWLHQEFHFFQLYEHHNLGLKERFIVIPAIPPPITSLIYLKLGFFKRLSKGNLGNGHSKEDLLPFQWQLQEFLCEPRIRDYGCYTSRRDIYSDPQQAEFPGKEAHVSLEYRLQQQP